MINFRYSKLTTVIIFLGIILVSLFLFIGVRHEVARTIENTKVTQKSQQRTNSDSSISNDDTQGDIGEITQNQDGTSLYVSDRYKFSFIFPSTWRIGDNRVGYGTFQLMSYAEPELGSSRFGKGQSKIELMLIDDPELFYLSEDDLNSHKNITISKTEVSGQETLRVTGDTLSYAIKVPSETGKYLTITLSGDHENYPVLESLIKSLSFF